MKDCIKKAFAKVNNDSPSDLRIVNEAIYDEEAAIIAKLLESSETIISVNLNRNHIGEKGFRAIANSLKYNTVVQELLIAYNNLNKEGMQALVNIFKTNAVMQDIYFHGNPVDEYPNIRDLYDRNKEYRKIVIEFTENFDKDKFKYGDIRKLKLSQKIKLFEDHAKNSYEVEKYIKDNFFELAGICKNFDKKNYFSLLAQEILNYIFSSLGKQSLWQIDYSKQSNNITTTQITDFEPEVIGAIDEY